MTFLTWLILIICTAVIVGTMILISTFYNEDNIWRVLISIIITIIMLVVFAGAYFAAERGMWWLSIVFGIVAFLTSYHFLEPD